MPATREMLEGEAYWGRIRLLKRRLYLIEAILIITLGAIVIFFAGGFKASPFFIAINWLLWLILLTFLVIMIESIIFRIIQLRIAKTDSTKHIMTINSMKKATVILIASIVVAILFASPTTVNPMEDVLSFGGVVTADSPQQFLTEDPMGMSKIESITLHSESGATVYLVTQHDYEQNQSWSFLSSVALNSRTNVDPDLIIEMPRIGYMYLYLLLDGNASPLGAAADFTLDRTFSSTLTAFLPAIALTFSLVNGAWIIYLWPLRKKYADKSIYK